MPIISQVGRKTWSVRLIYALLYVLLTAGGVTMLYPFLLMIATSLTSFVDYKEYRVVPRYFHDDEVKYQKVLYEKYGRAKDYSEMHVYEYSTFPQMGMPTYEGDAAPPTGERKDPQTGQPLPPRVVIDGTWDEIERRVTLWRGFQETLEPLDFGVWFTIKANMAGRSDLEWRERMRERFQTVTELNETYGKDFVSFTEVFCPYENPEGRLWPGVAGREGQDWREFKRTLDARYRRPIDGTILWQRFLRYRFQDVKRLNAALGSSYVDFRYCALHATRPADGKLRLQWDHAVRNELPYRFIRVDDGDAKYGAYLLERFGGRAGINAALDADYADDRPVRWPPASPTPKELDAVSDFLRSRVDLDHVTIDTPDKRYAVFLAGRFGSVDALNRHLGTSCTSFDAVRPPYEEEDLWEFHRDRGFWMKWFLTRNYVEVVDYVAIRGRALWNTLILVASMILCALTVNPLAAYALSRFRLGYTNGILLFL
ncbi:MAG TPA: hypothetical protein VMX57_05990, partial [Planctomycetota bacterium]|nr:hypothetical protein [Planctomycetota bacterium]